MGAFSFDLPQGTYPEAGFGGFAVPEAAASSGIGTNKWNVVYRVGSRHGGATLSGKSFSYTQYVAIGTLQDVDHAFRALTGLEYVRSGPTFKLPKELKRAYRQLNSGKYAKGIRALEKYLQKPKNEEVARAAKAAVKKVKAYGPQPLEEADDLADKGYYADAMDILSDLTRSFRRSDLGKQPKTKRSRWKKDKTIRLELRVAKVITQAEELARRKRYEKALAHLKSIVSSRKYAGTRGFEKAKTFDESC
jgi:tetratricopeptide (TPR) repeat protein